MAIMINDRRLDDMSEHDILAAVTAPGYPGFTSNPYHRNRELLRLFGERETMTEHLLVARFEKLHVDRGHSANFKAMRAGELIGWGIREGLVGAVPGDTLSWKLLEREPVYEFIGRERDQNAVRVRCLSGDAAVEAAAVWAKELKRRARAAARHEKWLEQHGAKQSEGAAR